MSFDTCSPFHLVGKDFFVVVVVVIVVSFGYCASFCSKLLNSQICLTGFVEDESPYAENGKKGTYFFEFSRPLRTMDHLQQVRN